MCAYRTRFESPALPYENHPNHPSAASPRRRKSANEAETDGPKASGGELVGKSKFVGLKALSGRHAHNFGIPIHNLWDEKSRNLWDSSIIYGTASQAGPYSPGPR